MALILSDGRPVERFGALTTGIAVGTDVDLVFDIPAATTSTTTAYRQDGSKTSDSPPYLSHDGYPSFALASTTALSIGADGPSYVFGIPAGRVASLSVTLGTVTSAALGKLLIQATLAKTLDAATLSSAGHLPVLATLSVTLDAATLNAAGTGGGALGPITGTLAATLADVTLSGGNQAVVWTLVDASGGIWTKLDPSTTTWH